MTNRNWIPILLVWFSLPSSHAGGAMSPADAVDTRVNTAARIARLEENLTPLVLVKGSSSRGYSLKERMEYYNVPGVSIAVINNNKLEWARGYGIADKRTGSRVDEYTMFRAGSISKPVTAAAAMRMVETGTLELDRDVNQYLSTWNVPDDEHTKLNHVTLRHLLSHTGGVTEGAYRGYAPGEEVPDLVQILDGTGPANTPPVRIETVPGTTWKYSNGGYCIVQMMMIEQTGRTFPQIMDELVLIPAGMTNSTFDQALSEDFQKRVASGYSSGDAVLDWSHILPEMAPAGLWSTPSDLARFAIAVMRSFAGEGGALLTQESAGEMLRVHMESYGLGFSLDDSGEDFSFSHGGSNDGYRCYLLVYPGRGQGAVIMTNSVSGDGLYYEILRTIALQFDWPGYRPLEKEIRHMDRERMADFTGKYLFNGKVVITFSIDEDHLRMDTSNNHYTLYPESDSKFFEIDFGFTLEFRRDASDEINDIIMDRGGVVSILTRIE